MRNIVFWGLAWTGLSAAVTGCNGPEPLTPYKVAKPRRMLVSTLVDLENNNAWFIKLDGPTTVVNRHEASFATLLDSIALTEGSEAISWEVPAGWSESEAGPVQFAALAVDDSANPIKVTVTRLPIAPDEDVDSYLLNNLNRWRRQLSLPPLDSLADAQFEERSVDGQKLVEMSLYGREPDGAEENAVGAAPSPRPPAGGMGSRSLNVDLPEGWEQGASTGVSALSAVVKDGDQSARFTVTPLPASPWPANVKRWVGQVGAEEMSDEKILEATKKIDVGGAEAQLIDLVAGPEVEPPRRLIGVRAIRGNTAWFVKFDGAPDIVAKEMENFKTLIMKLPLPE